MPLMLKSDEDLVVNRETFRTQPFQRFRYIPIGGFADGLRLSCAAPNQYVAQCERAATKLRLYNSANSR